MRRTWLAPRYVWTVAAMGLALWVWTLLRASPWLHLGEPSVVTTIQDTAIFMVLTILSTLSPIETRAGGVMSVNLAPCFGAVVLPLDPWAVMTVAALGTVDQRIPGKDIGWDRFAFNRGGFTLAYGIPSLLLAGPLRHDTQLRPLWMFVAAVIILSLNTLLTATAVSLIRGSTLIATIRTGLAGNALTYLALPLTGILIAHLIDGQQLADRLVVFLLYAPLLIYRASIQKQRRLDTWLRDSYIMQSRVVDKRDGQTFGHSQRVGELSERVARILKLSDDECNTIRVGGILHDLGKIAIPDSILLKPGKLTPEEYEIIKTHPVEGAQILAEHPEQKSVSEIVQHHHERWDGAGYPDGLSGEAIPIGSRIVNAVDAFDTITQARVFRPTVKTPLEAIRELRQLAGTWYDPKVIAALETIVAERWGVVLEDRPTQAKPVGYKDVLAIRPFRILWVGQAISYFGDMMNTTGLAIMLYLVTRSPSLVALGLISKAAPTILFGLIAGPVVDRTNRQRLMIAADLIRAPLTISIPFFAAVWLPGVFICVFLIAVASAFFNPAKQAILPNLVPSSLLPKANGMIFSSEKAMELLAYSSAGLIVVAVSWLPLFIVDGATYLVSAVSLLGIADRPVRRVQSGVNLLADIREGMEFVVKNATLRSTLALTFFAVFFAGLVFPVLVVMAYGPLHGGAFGYGLLEAAIGAGAIVGALVAADAMNRFPAGTLILGGVAGWGVAAALTGFAHSIWLAIVFLLASGAANMLYYVPLMSVTQHEAPDRIRGRVMASRFLIVQSALLLGMASSGPLTNQIGAPMVLVTAGTLLVIASFLGLAFPTLREATVHKELPKAALEATASAN